jgi:DedD protein
VSRGTTERPLALPLPEMVQPVPDEAGGEDAATTDAGEATVRAPQAAAAPTAVPPPVPDEAPQAVSPPAGQETARAAPPEPAGEALQPSGTPSGWIVQVASFANRENAETTVARLREAGFDSFQEQTRVGDKVLYRVGVGPEIDRARAEDLQARVAEATKLKGIVRRYP